MSRDAIDPRAADPEGREVDEAGRDELRRLAAEHPRWSAGDLADTFQGNHDWRPSPQAIARALGASPAPAPASADPEDPEIAAMSRVAEALEGLDPEATSRVMGWARARFVDREGGPR